MTTATPISLNLSLMRRLWRPFSGFAHSSKLAQSRALAQTEGTMSRSDDCLILIVEDNTGTATLQRRAVERAGYRVLTAGSAEEALEVLKADEVSLILLDNRLSGELSDLDFLTNLRSVSPDLPVIM